jgi:hypothetical protein
VSAEDDADVAHEDTLAIAVLVVKAEVVSGGVVLVAEVLPLMLIDLMFGVLEVLQLRPGLVESVVGLGGTRVLFEDGDGRQ